MSNILGNIGQSGKKELILKLILVFAAISLSAGVSEIALRIIGKTPGYIAGYGLIPVDQLKVLAPPQFIADEEGVYKANLKYNWSKEFQINSDGFRSIEFKPYSTTQRKILFLGDSFTWGNGAEPITESFVDIVSRSGYITFNTGIPGSGPRQYAFLAEKYGPLLKPDIIIIMFCMRNDFESLDMMIPHKNLWHITNAGWLYARDDKGNYLSAQDAYKKYYAKIYGEKNILQQLFYKSVIGTYVYMVTLKIRNKLMDYSDQSDMENNHAFVRAALLRIKAIADRNGAELMLFIIPVKPKLIENSRFRIDSNYHVFEDFSPFVPNFLTKNDFRPDGHFNNSGNNKFAEFILKGISSRLQ